MLRLRFRTYFHTFVQLGPSLPLKGELQCKTTLSGVKEGQKIRIFLVLVFCVDPPFKRKKPKKLWILKMLYSLLVDLQGKGIGLLVVLEGKGIRLLVVSGGRE